MKKPAVLVVLVLALLGGYFVASPYLALQGLGDALRSGNQTQLEAHVDFPALRQNIKDQLNAAFAKKMGEEDSENPFAAFAAVFAGVVVDKMIDAFVTPAGMAQLINGKDKQDAEKDAFANAETAFEGLGVFRVTLHHEDGSTLKLFLYRQGLSWKLSRIDLPLAALEKPAT